MHTPTFLRVTIFAGLIGGFHAAATAASLDRGALAAEIAAKVRDHYVLGEKSDSLAAGIELRLPDAAIHDLDAGGIREINRLLLETSGDVHLEVQAAPPDPAVASQPPSLADVLAAARRQTGIANGGFGRAEILEGNVGYLQIGSFQSSTFGASAAAAAFAFVARTDALILDLRQNEGGDPGMVNLICSYVTGPLPVHTNDIVDRNGATVRSYWTESIDETAAYRDKPLYVLTSRSTISAAEELAYDLQALKRARIVGEQTAGGAHLTRPIRLGQGLVLMVPFARSVNPITKSNWESVGVSPDLASPAPGALDAAHRAALEALAQSGDPAVRATAAAALAARAK